MLKASLSVASYLVLAALCSMVAASDLTRLDGAVIDAQTGAALACRIYIQGEDGQWYFPTSAAPQGSAVTYKKQNWANKNSVEMHTTLSAHPFSVDLPAGKYTITAERGKEYFPLKNVVTVGAEPVTLTLDLRRWVNMAELGWYSGDTHVHRSVDELANVQLAEDLNVSFPLSYWVTEAFQPPGAGDKSTDRKIEPRLIAIDDSHVIYPVNTEYEIFSVNDKSHTLGAVFILNHESVFPMGAPPVAPIARMARREGALLELDKHNWPWSMMLVPVMDVDLFELANNHMWRAEFAFAQFGEAAPPYMRIETDAKGFTELGWIEYGFANYYTLLNCGFDLRPTAGTASGVHPVPLGFGRVYVKLKGRFDYDEWVTGLNTGRSFVTTGPMLLVTTNRHDPGHVFHQAAGDPVAYAVKGTAQSAYPLTRIEIIVNGQVVGSIEAQNKKTRSGAYLNEIAESISMQASSWLAVRCYESSPGGRVRFAHTAPFHFRVPGRPLRPRKAEIEFLVERMKQQIARNESVLPGEALEEYRGALTIYERIAESSTQTSSVRLKVSDASTGSWAACRVHLKDSSGQPVLVDHLPSFRDHFCFDGDEVLSLPPGKYTYEIERGPEYERQRGSFEIRAGAQTDVAETLHRIADLAAEGWWSGDMHVHRSADDMELLMQVEDLHVAPILTWWNAQNAWADKALPDNRVLEFAGNRFCDLLAGEDERAGGAIMYFNMDRPVDITKAEREYPSAVYFIEQALRQPSAWIDIEKPFWWDVPVVLAHGYGHSIGLANNHCWRSTMLDNEAWGKPRDRIKYPGPHGNALWSQDIYYHILNSGIRIPPSAGSASGVLTNPVGYNRVYVYLGPGRLDHKAWWEALREGKCFVTNGPLIRPDVLGNKPGHVFTAPAGQTVTLAVNITLDSVDPIRHIEIIKNGSVERQVSYSDFAKNKTLGTVRFDKSGWFLVRVIAHLDHTFRFASTGPYYVQIGEDKHHLSRRSIRFFLDWVNERMSQIKIDDPHKYQEVIKYYRQAKRFWQDKLELANAD